MDVDFSSVQVAQRFMNSVALSLANVPPFATVKLIQRDRETKFEWHVETRGTRCIPIQLDTRKIMNRVGTFPDKADDAVKPTPTRRDFEGCAWNQSERA
jgi:hypothetical protein